MKIRTSPEGFLSNTLDIKMDSKSTASAVDRVDLADFAASRTCSLNNTKILMALATMAYSSPQLQRAHLKKQKAVESFHFLDTKKNASLGIDFPDTGTQVSVVETDKAVVFVARGTTPPFFARKGEENHAEWRDYVHDLAAVPTDNYDHSAKVHWGFKQAADGIWDQVKPLLEAARASHKAIHFAGHSLGAAVALMLADRMKTEEGVLPRSVFRAGGPDIGWGDERAHLEANGLAARTLNLVNNADPVTMVLPGGETPGHQIYFDRCGLARAEEGSRVLDRLLGVATGVVQGKLNPLYQHLPLTYHELVESEANQKTLGEILRNL